MTYVAVILLSVPVNGQCKYCNNYEDFLAGRWTKMDTVYAVHHSKGRQFWGGGNDYTLKTDNRSMNEKLKKEVLVVMQADTLFLNCRNLNYEKTYFGNGYTRAMRIGERSLLFVNKLIGRNAQSEQIAAAVLFRQREQFRAETTKRKEDLEKLAIGAEIVQGTLERQVEVHVGDNMRELMNVEVLVEDDKIVAIRG